MLRRLILHLGMGKTGSKTIQGFLRRNRPLLLARAKLLALGSEDVEPNPQDNLDDTSRFRQAIAQVRDRIVRHRAESLLWSLEGFTTLQFLRDPARIAALRSAFEAEQVRLVAYLRRQDLFAVSAYLQWNVVNKTYPGPVQSFDERFPCVYGEPDGTPLEQTNLNYYELLVPWATAFGRDNLRVRPLEEQQLVGGDLLHDFRDAAGLPDLPYDFRVPRRNQTFNRELNDLLGMYASAHEGQVFAGDMIFFFRSFGHDAFFNEAAFHAFELPPARRIAILEACREINAQVARDFLGRNDGVLFRDPWPAADDPYTPYPGMTLERLVPILLHILKKQHAQINFLMNERRRQIDRYSWGRVRATYEHKVKPALARLLGR